MNFVKLLQKLDKRSTYGRLDKDGKPIIMEVPTDDMGFGIHQDLVTFTNDFEPMSISSSQIRKESK